MRRPIRNIIAGTGTLVWLTVLSLAIPSGKLGQAGIVQAAETAATPTAGEAAANGPLPGFVSLYGSEQACIDAAQDAYPGWYPTLVSGEHGGTGGVAGRTGLFACASFTGSFDGPNQVLTDRSQGVFETPYNILTKSPTEAYIYGGGSGEAIPPPPGPFVARFNPSTGAEVWRTVLDNIAASGQWNVLTAINLGADGTIMALFGHQLAKLDAETGAVLAWTDLPAGPADPLSLSYDGGVFGPDGTFFPKTQTRPLHCTIQGFPALFLCPHPETAPNSVIAAVDPTTLKILDWIEMPEMVGGRDTLAVYEGHTYLYLVARTKVYRYEWDSQAKKLALDTAWGPVPYLEPGQTGGSAPAIMGDWVVFQTNGSPSSAPMSVVAIHQGDASKVVRLNPMPLPAGAQSYLPSMVSVDPENQMIYGFDHGAGQQVGVRFADGKMDLVWRVDARTLSFMTLVGPREQRVFVATNMSRPQANPSDYGYQEQIQWRNAATGALLAESDFFPAMNPGILVTPGYGGRVYEMLADGHVMILQVVPARS